ncbi:MAG: DUF4395 domain-containing protein [Anaerolineae bacterium]|jgi:hypothetical protein|nr:DUF4395 domain-containing protein [Anaerolineae bacterium]
MPRKVDHNALRTHQAFMIILLVLAFVLDLPALVVFMATVMVIGAAYPPARLFVWVYQQILKPAGWIKPDVQIDNPEPHRFAMVVGGVFLVVSSIALLTGATVVGWILTGVVVVLAALNLFAGFCAGCFMYYQLNKLGVPGFTHAPVEV